MHRSFDDLLGRQTEVKSEAIASMPLQCEQRAVNCEEFKRSNENVIEVTDNVYAEDALVFVTNEDERKVDVPEVKRHRTEMI